MARQGLTRAILVLSAAVLGQGERHDFERDRVVLRGGKELRGVVLQSFAPDHVLLLREGNRREEIPRAEIERVDSLRARLAAFLRIRRPGLALESEWDLVADARSVGLERTARLQAYHVLLRDPRHAEAHAFLGHRRAGDGWKWALDGELVSAQAFSARSADWNQRLVLAGEHVTLETNCGLRRAVDTLFDLESLYVWWLEHLGPALQAAEDVDDPQRERIVFRVHQGREDPSFEQLTSEREPYYDPSGGSAEFNPCSNVAHTYYPEDGDRPLRLFELGTEVLMYTTLVLGRTLDEDDHKLRRLSHWAEVGLGAWVARHASGPPGHPGFRAPFAQAFTLDPGTVAASLAPIRAPHLLLKGRSELANLVALPFFELEGGEENVPEARARCATFVSFLLEEDPLPDAREASAGGGRDAFWRYLREVYGRQQAYSREAFDAGLAGGSVGGFEARWRAWTAGLAR
jgi:hypothetical protein